MNLVFGLSQQQSQQLTMTTEMRQALHLLELGSDDLIEYVSQKAEANLFLQVRKHETTRRVMAPRSSRERFDLSRGQPFAPSRPELASPVSLVDDIKAQVRYTVHDLSLLPKVLRVVDDLDERGYLDEYSHALGVALGLSEREYNESVAVIQTCDPLGIGARSLQECLILQVQQLSGKIKSHVQALIERHLDDLAAGQMTAISKSLGCSLDELYEAIHALRGLNPKPGQNLTPQPVVAIKPDLFIEAVHSNDSGAVLDGRGAASQGPDAGSYATGTVSYDWGTVSYVVTLAGDVSGLVQFDSTYQELRRATLDVEARQYLNTQWREAQWIQRCIVQRGVTLQRIGEALCAIQSSFFTSGWAELRPMTLSDVAEVLGVHESTVSRAIRNKWAATPQGLIELKTLFSSGVKTVHGEVSSEAIKYRIRQLLRDEKLQGPYTDAELAEQFVKEGISISRRTVAKYRDAMGIPSAAQRKRMA